MDNLPRRDSVATLIERNGRWADDGSFELASNAQREYRFTLHVPPASQVVDTLLGRAVPGFALSDKGRLASALAAQVDVEVLLSPGVYEAIVALTTPRSRALLRELQRAATSDSGRLVEIAATWGGRSERRYRNARQLREAVGPESIRALECLASMKWAERGFEVQCDRCGVASFVPVPNLREGTACPGCAARATLSTDRVGPIVVYRLNSFVDRASDQGVLPHLLVIAALKRREAASHLVPGVVFPVDASGTGEVDIFGTMGPTVVAGEVKTSAGAFSVKQIRRDVAVTRRLGADVHIMAAVDDIPGDVSDVLEQQARRKNLETIVLGRSELRPQ